MFKRLAGPPDPPPAPPLPDIDVAAAHIIERVRPYTMTSAERLFAVIEAARYIAAARIPGDVVECGVWRGGSMMAAAAALLDANDGERHLHRFDTFEGMSEPGEEDVDLAGAAATEMLSAQDRNDPASIWCYATMGEVQEALATTSYESARMHFVQGRVEDTIPAQAPGSIALLRLDTDWYESTRHELEHLYPRLSVGGVLIVDDYGHWAGCRRAVNEYFAARGTPVLLNRIDYTGRSLVKRA